MSVDLTKTNIEVKEYQLLLEDLQGNILQGYEQDYAVQIFLKFESDAQATRQWIRDFAAEFVTSAQHQLNEPQKYSQDSSQNFPKLWANFFLSAHGYQALGFELKGKRLQFPSWTFLAGMKAFKPILSDPPIDQWQDGFRGDIDALILLAADQSEYLQQQAKTVMKAVSHVACIVNTEVGHILRNAQIQPNGKGQTIEHFGFRDGISQPLFFKQDIEQRQQQGNDQWDACAPLELVLVKDPFGQGENSYGSYCVYRKLKQDVQGFRQREKQLVQKLGLTGNDAERAGALVIGRFRDGTPITLSNSGQGDTTIVNNFNYADDTEGTKCPFHAHIRKTNPRGDRGDSVESLEEQRQHRIVRRAIPYGGTSPEQQTLTSAISRLREHLTSLPHEALRVENNEGVGLLFLCFQRDIFNQFMFMQKSWVNQKNFVKYDTGLDPVAGQGKQLDGGQKWSKEWGQEEKVSFEFNNFVRMQGGEFFFAPSISFLANI
ncbi:Dyp-type peroxidase [Coleofasciculus chthonoplastes]|uniref:Dyp-type peroxidase n=1 Tax=Coleofasciculus TaxID=669368 RepID=UPI003302273D